MHGLPGGVEDELGGVLSDGVVAGELGVLLALDELDALDEDDAVDGGGVYVCGGGGTLPFEAIICRLGIFISGWPAR